MTHFEAMVLGIVQGLTEFLPVSSTAHLALVPWLMGWSDPGLAFDVALHVGTLLAVTVFFRQDLWAMAKAFVKSLPRPDLSDAYQRLAWWVIVGCVPAVVAGVLLEDWIEGALRSPAVIATMLITVALLIAWAERRGSLTRDLEHLTWREALLIGLAQACALIPGTSRSGATMTMALFLGFARPEAARFSFLLGYPVILGSALFKLKDLAATGALSTHAVPLAIGIASSAVSGYLCVRFLLRFLASHTMTVFVVYRIVLGLVIIGLLASGMGGGLGL